MKKIILTIALGLLPITGFAAGGAHEPVLDKYTLVERAGTRTVYNWLQYFSADGLKREFVDAGLAIEAFYADVAGSPFEADGTEFAAVARKAAASSRRPRA